MNKLFFAHLGAFIIIMYGFIGIIPVIIAFYSEPEPYIAFGGELTIQGVKFADIVKHLFIMSFGAFVEVGIRMYETIRTSRKNVQPVYRTDMHSDGCESCKISQGERPVEGGTIKLGSHWMVNHYQDERDRFLGWLAIQPFKHRISWSELTIEELHEFGIVTQKLEKALIDSYNFFHANDKAEIVYLVRLGESTLEQPVKWHLHWHMIPRTKSMKGKYEGWNIEKCQREHLKPNPRKEEIQQFMDHMRQELQNTI